MTTVANFIDAALSEKGYTECPRDAQGHCIFTGHGGPGANHTKFAAEAGHVNGEPWCDTFVVAIARRTGVTLPTSSAYTPTSANGYRAAGTWHTTDPQPGDQVFYQWPGSAEIDHTGIVVSVEGRTLHTIEGNTSADNNGSQSNGGGAFARTRPWDSTVKGFGRPVFSAAPTPTPPQPVQEDDDMPRLVNFESADYLVGYDGATGEPWRRTIPNPSREAQLVGGGGVVSNNGSPFSVTNDQFLLVYADKGPA